MKNKILIIYNTHGDERIGIEVIDRLKKKRLDRYFDYLIGNPRASKKGVRFTEVDLNRSYPGEEGSPVYEKRLAYKNLQKAKKYQFIIDIHEASSGINDFIIIPREKNRNSFPIDLVDSAVVLFWPNPKGALGQFLNNSIELEFGMKGINRQSAVSKAERIVTKFIEKVYCLSIYTKLPKKKFYHVYGKIMTKDFSGDYRDLKDFQKTKMEGKTFYPLLVGQYIKNGIVCYKMELIKNN